MLQTILRGVVRGVLRPTFSPNVSIERQRSILGLATALRLLPRGLQHESITLGGRPALKTAAADARSGVVLYLHGGAYCAGSPDTHRTICSWLAQKGNCAVYAIDYRLAPEHPFPAGLDDALAAYRELLEQGVEARHIAVAGDSAGGGLTLALAQRIRAAGLPAPALLYLISPWVDLTFTGESLKTLADKDPMVTEAWIRAGAAHYVADGNAADPLISPAFADFKGLSPILVQVGSDEVLLSDSARVVERARAAGVDVEHRIYDGLWHVFQIFAGTLPASTQAVADAAAVMRRRWDA